NEENTTAQENTQNNTNTDNQETPTETENNDLVATFTREEVAAANSISSECLVIYNTSVYRIPQSWANAHPGGSFAITSSCGRDITSDFERSHRGSSRPASQISEFFVGTLK